MSDFLYIIRIKEFSLSSPNSTRLAGHVARMEEERGVHKVFVGKPDGKRPLERPSRR